MLLLIRWPIAFAVALTGLAGYFAANGSSTTIALILFFSLSSLAATCSILNQIQEQAIDAKWPRTANRPLPSGRINSITAILFAALFFALACVGLYNIHASFNLIILALLVVFIYNGLYTNSKKTGWPALFTGAIAGAMPPFFGWLAAGKGFDFLLIWALFFLLFCWQFPHVLLHTLNQQSQGQQRPPIPNLPENILRSHLNKGYIAFALSICFLALIAQDFNLCWRIFCFLLAVPFFIQAHIKLKIKDNLAIKITDGTIGLIMLLTILN